MRFVRYLVRPLPGCFLIAVISALVWGQTVRFDFVWDDYVLVLQNKSILSLGNIPAMFYSLDAQSSQNMDVPLAQKIPSFRPLRTAHYALLHTLDGNAAPQPWIFHLANIIWHTIAALLLFSVALLLFARQADGGSDFARLLALLLAIGFLVHPVTTEIVCWVKSLDDLMATVFVLAATRFLLKWNESKREYAAALVCFVLAAYAKESAVPFAALVFFIFNGFHRLSWRRSFKYALPFFAAGLVYMAHRHFVMGRSDQSAPLSGSYGQTLVDMFPVGLKYLRLLCGIGPFSMDYDFMHGRYAILSIPVLSGVILLALTLGLTAWLWRRPAGRLAAFGLLWVLVFLLPVSNLLPMMQYMAERFLYLPLIGFMLVLGALLLRCPKPKFTLLAMLALIAIWIPATCSRAAIWQDELTLFLHSSMENPHSKRVEKNAVVAIFRLPQMRLLFPEYLATQKLIMPESLSPAQAEPVIQTLLEAHRLLPDNTLVSTSLAFTYAKIGRFDEAVPLLELVTRQDSNSPRAWFNAASVYWAANNLAQARAAVEKSLQLDPNFADARRLQTNLPSK